MNQRRKAKRHNCKISKVRCCQQRNPSRKTKRHNAQISKVRCSQQTTRCRKANRNNSKISKGRCCSTLIYYPLLCSPLHYSSLLYILFYSILRCFTLPFRIGPALLPEQEQKQEQEQEQAQEPDQEQDQEQHVLLWNWNCFSTDLFVKLQQARPVVAQRNRSGRALALAGAALPFRSRTYPQKLFTHVLSVLRYDLSHLYRGMRLPTVP